MITAAEALKRSTEAARRIESERIRAEKEMMHSNPDYLRLEAAISKAIEIAIEEGKTSARIRVPGNVSQKVVKLLVDVFCEQGFVFDGSASNLSFNWHRGAW